MIVAVDDLVDFKVSSKSNDIKLVYSYIFEQIVSLYTYTVSNFHGDRCKADFFSQQMRFTGAVTQKLSEASYTSNADEEKEVKNKIAYVLSLLDKGEKALDILEKIKSEGSLLNERDVRRVESAMEENSIIFARSFTEHPYSFQAMYSILKNPLLVFNRFLYLPDPGELLNIVIKCRLGQKIDRDELLRKETNGPDFSRVMRLISPLKSYTPLSHGAVIESYNDQEVTLELLLEACGDERINLDKSDFTELITRSIDDVLQGWASWVLDSLFPTSSKSQPMIDSLIDGVSLKQEGIIKLNMEDLKKLCFLGQAEQISDMLSKKIKELYITDEKEKDKVLHTDPSQLSAIAKWYRSCRMSYITEVSQIPSIIAALLYNRLEEGAFYEYVMCSDNEIVDYPEKNKVESLQRLVTFIIDKNLYHTEKWPSLPYKDKCSFFEPINTIDKYFDSYKASESNLLPNSSMVDWVTYDKIKTRDRFKRPLKKFRSGINQAKHKIEKQKQQGVHNYFPVSNSYPLPFWAKK